MRHDGDPTFRTCAGDQMVRRPPRNRPVVFTWEVTCRLLGCEGQVSGVIYKDPRLFHRPVANYSYVVFPFVKNFHFCSQALLDPAPKGCSSVFPLRLLAPHRLG